MRPRRIVPRMLTVVETLLFQRQWPLEIRRALEE